MKAKVSKDGDQSYSLRCSCGYLASGFERQKDARAWAKDHEYEHAEGVLMHQERTDKE